MRAHFVVVVFLAALGGPVARAEEYTRLSGQQLYQKFCASCHGTAGKGDGPIAKQLKTPPADLTAIARRYGDTFPTRRIEEVVDGRVKVDAHGPSAMPVWGEEFTRSEAGKPAAESDTAQVIHKIVEYLKSIQGSPSI